MQDNLSITQNGEGLRPLLQKPAYPILIVEDDPVNRALISRLCEKLQVESEAVENGRAALDLMKNSETRYSVYIIDLMMPEMSGLELIPEIKRLDRDAVILVQTSVDDIETIIKVMRLGVFDYIIKPVDLMDFPRILSRATEYFILKEQEKKRTDQAAIQIRSQLDWLNYKESRRMISSESLEKNLIHNLKQSMSQGAGFGSTTTILELIKNQATTQGDFYLIKKDLMDLVFENNEISINLMEGLSSITDLLEEDSEIGAVNSSEIVQLIEPIVTDLKEYLEKRSIFVSLPDQPEIRRVHAALDRLSLVLEELIINAFKYSPSGARVDIYSYYSSGYFCIVVKNDAGKQGEIKGIPADYEKMVLEPFIRLHPPEESIARKEKFGLGLGLTVVDHIVKQHNGMFFIHNVNDHTGSEPRLCVQAEIFLPLAEE